MRRPTLREVEELAGGVSAAITGEAAAAIRPDARNERREVFMRHRIRVGHSGRNANFGAFSSHWKTRRRKIPVTGSSRAAYDHDMNRDLEDAKWMYAKAAMFLGIAACCASLLWMENPKWTTAVFIALLVWAAARLYYFMFYVITNYVDSGHKFSGVLSFVRYLLSKRR
jgi:hypothetical protein